MKESVRDRLLLSFMYVAIAIFAALCLIPFFTMISGSLTTELSIKKYGFKLFPTEFTLEAYKLLLKDSTIYKAYGVTMFVTVVGTVLAMLVTCMMAYPLSLRSVKYRNHVNFYVFFTMLFHGGLVTSYILITKYLGMKDSIWVLIIPSLLNPFNMFLLRNFFQSIDESLAESAKIDGANDIYIMFRIMLPFQCPPLRASACFMLWRSGTNGLKRCSIFRSPICFRCNISSSEFWTTPNLANCLRPLPGFLYLKFQRLQRGWPQL